MLAAKRDIRQHGDVEIFRTTRSDTRYSDTLILVHTWHEYSTYQRFTSEYLHE